MTTCSRDDGQWEQWAASRRRVARMHHPDLGGDADEFIRSLAQVDAQFGRAGTGGGSRLRTRPPSALKRARYRLRRRRRAGVRRLRSALPRGFPGARRSIEL
ncbi:hypothetical protein BH20ACT6_BH20ACT6_19030 [soil metagenome]